MKENSMWNLLLYLFSNQLRRDGQFDQVMEALLKELEKSGNEDSVTTRAIHWLRDLLTDSDCNTAAPHAQSFRIYSSQENSVLSTECQNLLLTLEKQQIITPHIRELVIERVTSLADEVAEPSLVKWVTLMTLLQHEQDDRAQACMQLIALDDIEGGTQ